MTAHAPTHYQSSASTISLVQREQFCRWNPHYLRMWQLSMALLHTRSGCCGGFIIKLGRFLPRWTWLKRLRRSGHTLSDGARFPRAFVASPFARASLPCGCAACVRLNAGIHKMLVSSDWRAGPSKAAPHTRIRASAGRGGSRASRATVGAVRGLGLLRGVAREAAEERRRAPVVRTVRRALEGRVSGPRSDHRSCPVGGTFTG